MRKYTILCQEYSRGQKINVDPKCNGIQVINRGADAIMVNGITLFSATLWETQSGESINIGGNEGEIFAGRLDVTMSSSQSKAVVIQKIYI